MKLICHRNVLFWPHNNYLRRESLWVTSFFLEAVVVQMVLFSIQVQALTPAEFLL
jgi:hypothetical protein